MAIPKKYFLLNTMRWLKISDNRNWIAEKPNGATTNVTTTYSAATSAFITRLRVFTFYSSLSFDYAGRSEEHTSELQSRFDLVCRLLLEKKKNEQYIQESEDGFDSMTGSRGSEPVN